MIPHSETERLDVPPPPEGGARPRGFLLRGILGLLALDLLLVLPAYNDELYWEFFVRLPIELPILVLALFAAPRPLQRWSLALVALALGVLVAVKLANLAAFTAYARPFNAFLHLHLIPAGLHLLASSAGLPLAILAALGAAALLAALGWGIVAALRAVAAGFTSRRVPIAIAVLMLAGYAVLDVADVRAAGEKTATAYTTSFVNDQIRWHWQTFGDLARFKEEMAADEQQRPAETLLSKLRGKDVVLVFVESYGRTAIENPRFTPVVGAALKDFDAALETSGFAARSGWLASSTIGGQSWLAHATLLSGLRVDGQGRYDALHLSGRPTLIHDFGRAGWETVGLMPGITTQWPEAASFGYQRVHAAADLGYAGQPFGWISMPDQYSLSALQRLVLDPAPRRPVMATVVLISSHLPWTPIPRLFPWDQLGDGAVFTAEARSGMPVETIWSDLDDVRGHYALSIDYVLRSLAGFVDRHGRDDTVLIVLGDHQPAPFVSGYASSPAVPIHIIARDRAVLAAIGNWHWSEGMTPAPEVAVWPMEAFRGRLIEAFTSPTPAAGKVIARKGTP